MPLFLYNTENIQLEIIPKTEVFGFIIDVEEGFRQYAKLLKKNTKVYEGTDRVSAVNILSKDITDYNVYVTLDKTDELYYDQFRALIHLIDRSKRSCYKLSSKLDYKRRVSAAIPKSIISQVLTFLSNFNMKDEYNYFNAYFKAYEVTDYIIKDYEIQRERSIIEDKYKLDKYIDLLKNSILCVYPLNRKDYLELLDYDISYDFHYY